MKLVYVINGLGPGGAEHSLAELLPHYVRAGVHPVVVCLRERDIGVEADVRRIGCEVRMLGGSGLLAQARELRRLAKTEKADLIHTTLFESNLVGRFASIRTGVPVLTSLVNTGYEPIRLEDPNVGRMNLWATRVADGWTARHLTDRFHAITEAVKSSAVRHLGIPADKVTVVERGRSRERLGFPGAERRRRARSGLGLAEDEEVVVNVARQEYQKGQKYLLEAASILAPSRPRLVVLICGRDGHVTRELRALHARLGLGGRVQFLGDRPDVPDVLAAADVFAFPSIYEGLGGAVIEAMAMGLPIVASDIPALREVVEAGRNALLVPSQAPAPLAAALAEVLDEPTAASSFGRRSREIFRKRFTIERSARRMIELYADVVGSPSFEIEASSAVSVG